MGASTSYQVKKCISCGCSDADGLDNGKGFQPKMTICEVEVEKDDVSPFINGNVFANPSATQALALPVVNRRRKESDCSNPGVGDMLMESGLDKGYDARATACATRSTVDTLASDIDNSMMDTFTFGNYQIQNAGCDFEDRCVTQDTNCEHESGRTAGDPVESWLDRLVQGTSLELDQDIVRVKLDREFDCLAILDHELLFPLSDLRTCSPVSPESAVLDLPNTGKKQRFDLEVAFADYDVLVFHLCTNTDRIALASVLETLASKARADNFPEGIGVCSDAGV